MYTIEDLELFSDYTREYPEIEFEVLKGKTITSIEGIKQYSDQIIFHCSDGSQYLMFHRQDCCENVSLEEFVGDPNTILNEEILQIYKTTRSEHESEFESFTWTFYTIRTMSGTLTLRWKGTSNGFYSEEVNFIKIGESNGSFN